MPRPRKDQAVTPLPNEPDFIIQPPGIILEGRRGEGLWEVETSIWVKLSVRFRNVLREFEDSMLHVFLSVALHIGRNGQSFPSLETIAEETGFEKQAVRRSLKRLEEKGFLTVHHRAGHASVFAVSQYVTMGVNNDPKTPYHDDKGFSLTPYYDDKGLSPNPLSPTIPEEDKYLRRLKESAQPYFLSLMLAAVCRISYAVNKSACLGFAKKLAECGATPERILRDYGGAGLWYEQDWRGKKGQPPTLEQVKATWGTFHPEGGEQSVTAPQESNKADDGGFDA